MFDGFYKGKSILVTGQTGFKGSWDDLTDPQVLHEAKLLKLNCDKAHAELNWYSALTIDDCLQMTATWYKKFYEANPPRSDACMCIKKER